MAGGSRTAAQDDRSRSIAACNSEGYTTVPQGPMSDGQIEPGSAAPQPGAPRMTDEVLHSWAPWRICGHGLSSTCAIVAWRSSRYRPTGWIGGVMPAAPLNTSPCCSTTPLPNSDSSRTPNQDVVYGFGMLWPWTRGPSSCRSPTSGPVWVYQLGDQRTDGFGEAGHAASRRSHHGRWRTGPGRRCWTCTTHRCCPAAGRGRRHHPVPEQGPLRVLESSFDHGAP